MENTWLLKETGLVFWAGQSLTCGTQTRPEVESSARLGLRTQVEGGTGRRPPSGLQPQAVFGAKEETPRELDAVDHDFLSEEGSPSKRQMLVFVYSVGEICF